VRGTSEYLRNLNRSAVLAAIWKQPGLSRTEIAEHLGLSKSTVSTAVSELVGRQLVKDAQGRTGHKVGRPSRPLELDLERNAVLGWELGVGLVQLRVMNLAGQVMASRQTDAAGLGPAETLELLGELSEEALAETGWPVLRGLGLAVPGLVSPSDGQLQLAPNLDWSGVPLGVLLLAEAKRFLPRSGDEGFPAVLDNEANAGAAALLDWPQARARNLAYLSLDIGLGAGLILNHRLFTGGRGYAGEAGHLCIEPTGQPCHCGKRGCAETRINLRRWRQASGDRNRLAEEMGGDLGLLLSHLANLLDLDSIVLGGRLLEEAGGAFLEASRESLATHTLRGVQAHLQLLVSPYGQATSVIGAGALAAQVFFSQPRPEGSLEEWTSFTAWLRPAG
jgi:predicted NBD/HSP70 family sugar kinase